MSPKTISAVVRFFGKLEGMLKKYPPLIALILVIGWIVWPAQAPKVMRSVDWEEVSKERWSRGTFLDQKKKREFSSEFCDFSEKITDEAKKMGRGYGPWEYFKHMKEVEKWIRDSRWESYEYDLVSSTQQFLREKMKYNLDIPYRGPFSSEDLGDAYQDFENWKNQMWPPSPKEPFQWGKFYAFLSWFLVLYLRSFPFVFLLYFNRMVNRRESILVGMLGDKKKFALSVLLWPILVWNAYNEHYFREVVAEAELRRLGLAFRKLSLRERMAVKNAGSMGRKDFRRWRREFRTSHQPEIQRGFGLALALTMIIMIFLPSLSRGSPVRDCRGPTVVMVSVAQIVTDESSGSDLTTVSQTPDAMPEEFILPDPPRLESTVEIRKDNKAQGAVGKIFHVPLFTGCALAA